MSSWGPAERFLSGTLGNGLSCKVRQGQKMLNDGRPMVEVIKELHVTEATWYRWLNQYGSEKNAKACKRTQGAGEGERPAQAAAG
jgi:transposase